MKDERIATAEQNSVIEFLSTPASYGLNGSIVERFETHGAIVFAAGNRAYKLKRAVRFPYMDYSTVEKRHEMCAREFEINRRTAAMLYLTVQPIIREADGRLRFGSADQIESALDWVVVMRRFDQRCLFENMRRSGQLSRPLMRTAAEIVAAFHRSADITAGLGGSEAMNEVIEENCAILNERAGHPFHPDLIARYCEESRQLHAQSATLLNQRRENGWVRRCHGDLHLNNICMWAGRPILFDAIEFNEKFSCIDVLYDLAFLLMDLGRHGLQDLANAVLNRYLELTEQHAGLPVLPLFISCRAAVRAHTLVAASEAISDQSAASTLFADSDSLLRLAIDVLVRPPPRLIAIGGISGTGKSTLAYGLAPVFGPMPGAIVVRSDIIRKQLFGVTETARLPQQAYMAAVNQEVYRRILELARICLAGGYSVIADAVYGADDERRAIAQLAGDLGVPFSGLWLQAPTDVVERRLTQRHGDASDATVEVMRAQMQFVRPPANWVGIAASGTPTEMVASAIRCLRR